MELARLLSTLVCGRGRIILVYFWRFRLLSCEILPTLQSGVLSAATLTVNFENRIITAATNIVQFFFVLYGNDVSRKSLDETRHTPYFFVACVQLLCHRVGYKNCCFVHVALVPEMGSPGEQKTKPTQHSVKQMRALGEKLVTWYMNAPCSVPSCWHLLL